LTGTLYYKPRVGENMKNAVVILPRLETLISGTNTNNIQFKGITFSYAIWLLPNSLYGFPCGQADNIKSLQMPGNIRFDHSSNFHFEDNNFTHLGVTGLQLYLGCKNNIIKNIIFNDISGSAISLGSVTKLDSTKIDLVKDNVVSNNLISSGKFPAACGE
jgi:hypothetical protein